MSTTEISKQFEQLWSSAASDTDLMQARSDALAEFERKGFPNRKQEHWKYTDVRPLAEGQFELAPPAPDIDTIERARERLAECSIGTSPHRLVFVDGTLARALSSTQDANGLSLLDLAQHPEALLDAAGVQPVRDHVLATLNRAFAREGAIVRVAAGAEISEPLELIFVGSGRQLAPQPRVLIELEDNAAACVVQHFVDLRGGEASWTNIVTSIKQQSGSRLELYRLQEHDKSGTHTGLVAASLERDARLTFGSVELGGRLVRNDFDISLSEPGATADLFGITLARDRQHIDNHLVVDHRAAHTLSQQNFRAIAADRGRAVFNGKVIVREGAQQIDARQKSDNLLLSDKAEIDTKPELEIYADDVKCSHGATVGELDENQLFYLRGRGIDADVARGLLTFAFANTLLERIELPALRERAALELAGQLPETFDMDETLQ